MQFGVNNLDFIGPVALFLFILMLMLETKAEYTKRWKAEGKSTKQINAWWSSKQNQKSADTTNAGIVDGDRGTIPVITDAMQLVVNAHNHPAEWAPRRDAFLSNREEDKEARYKVIRQRRKDWAEATGRDPVTGYKLRHE